MRRHDALQQTLAQRAVDYLVPGLRRLPTTDITVPSPGNPLARVKSLTDHILKETSMQVSVIDAIGRGVAEFSRPGAFLPLGLAGLPLLGAQSSAQAENSNKKANRKARKKGKKKCKKQDGQCVQVFEDICAAEADPELCENLFIPCCAFLAQCQTTSFFECAFASAA